MYKSVKTLDTLDQHFTPEKNLHQIDARMIFTTAEQPLDRLAYIQLQKRKLTYIQCSLSGTDFSWFLRLHESYKKGWSAFLSAIEKQSSSLKNAFYAQLEALAVTKKETEKVRHNVLKVQKIIEKF